MTSGHHDIRMRGFSARTPVDRVWQWIDDHVMTLEPERISLWQAAGRTLAAPAVAPCDVPAFPRAMMDGYAVSALDTQGASAYQPLSLRVTGEALPGRPTEQHVVHGTAIRIMTGAPLPIGADGVVPAESATQQGEYVQLTDEIPPGKHVGAIGEDVVRGQTVLTAGRRLRPQDLGLLSSLGQAEVLVVRSPRVAIWVTGNEILPAGSTAEPYQVVDANGPMLAALVARDGGQIVQQSILFDDPGTLRSALQTEADVVLISGGSSVGLEDHAPRLVAELGHLVFHGIAMRPSSPAGLGTIGERRVFLLPGNPVSNLAAYDFFAGRAIRRLGGRPSPWPYRSTILPLARKLVSQIGRTDYARVRVQDGEVEPLAISGAAILSSTSVADGFVVVDENSEGAGPGTLVEVFLYD